MLIYILTQKNKIWYIMEKMYKISASIFLFCSFFLLPCIAESISFQFKGNTSYYQVERSNFSRYDNGKYTGLTHRETRSTMNGQFFEKEGIHFNGFFYVLEETLKDLSRTAQALDTIVEASFSVFPTGETHFTIDNGYPRLRSFPVFPETAISLGETWQAEGIRVVDPKNSGKKTFLPVLVEYTFVKTESYRGKDVHRIKARYATRLTKYSKIKNEDPDLVLATGSHDVDILIDAESLTTQMILDRLDEIFTYENGDTIRLKGNTAIFTDDVYVKNKQKQITHNFVELKQDSNFHVDETPQGIRLSIRDIKFIADSDNLLPEERERLDALAKMLLSIPDGHFLVEGHTASVGKKEGEKELSIKRALKIILEMKTRGLREEQFIYTGHGGEKPVADNEDATGRAENRRVEITILE